MITSIYLLLRPVRRFSINIPHEVRQVGVA
jgi:hypothetical protein